MHCLESTGACACDAGFDLVDASCVNAREVACAAVTPPANAHQVAAQVTITYTAADGWSAPAACLWACDTDYDSTGSECINTKLVACTTIAPPVNAHQLLTEVPVTFTSAGGWSTAADCAWACDTDYDDVSGECLNVQDVPCASVVPPSHGHEVASIETITFTTSGGWTDPATCAWACDTDYETTGSACINTKLTSCATITPPTHAHQVTVDVTVTYTSAGGWSTPTDCAWACDPDYGDVDGACLNSQQVACSAAAVPTHATKVDASVTITYTTVGGWTSPAACAWSCNTDYFDTGSDCINSRTEACTPAAAPTNAHSVSAPVTVTYTTADGWSPPASCAWACNTDYDNVSDSCVNSQVVACAIAAVPVHASYTAADVTITFTTAGGWTSPDTCAWTCDTDYFDTGSDCINTQQVVCTPATAPEHAHSVSVLVSITYTTLGGWATPETCTWACDTDYDNVTGSCLNSQVVACSMAAVPEHATAVAADVTITFTTAGGWTTPADCVWDCDAGYHEEEQSCPADVTIVACGVATPGVTGFFGDANPVLGTVNAVGTDGVGRLAGIVGRLCYDDVTFDGTGDLAALTCVEASFDADLADDDRYTAPLNPGQSGTYYYIYEFSGDGGATWMLCDTAANSTPPLATGVATLTGWSYSQNFDTLAASGSPSWSNGVTVPGWYLAQGAGGEVTSYRVGDGTSSTGGIYSFGTGAAAERALGGLVTNSTSALQYAYKLANPGSGTLASVTVSYTGEQWRVANSVAQKLVFEYQVVATDSTSIPTGTWVAVPALDFTSPKVTATSAALNGNLAENRQVLTANIAVNVPVGQWLWLRWSDANESGSDDGFGLDDVSIISE